MCIGGESLHEWLLAWIIVLAIVGFVMKSYGEGQKLMFGLNNTVEGWGLTDSDSSCYFVYIYVYLSCSVIL